MIRIAVPIPTSHSESYNQENWCVYADALKREGAEAVAFPLDLSHDERTLLAASCDGVVLPGSPADIDPARYGHDREEASAVADPQREQTDFFLIEHVLREELPLLGICFGLQSINVYFGGTLVQDVAPWPVPHSCARSVISAHSVVINPRSRLAAIAAEGEIHRVADQLRLMVNSSHHQAVGVPGNNLAVSARCPQDGVIEALERAEARQFFLGVQWHPERTYDVSATSRALFGNLVRDAVERRKQKISFDVGV